MSGLLQKTAALIVFGGTIAAVVASFPAHRLRTIPAALRMAFGRNNNESGIWVEELVEMSSIARRSGVLALERKVMDHPHPFLQDGIQMVVDGTDQDVVRQILEMEIDSIEQKHEGYAKIFESAGGYAPTMGIIGTVMGLIQVLGSLTDPTGLGPAIAVAFTATLYGVASANLIFCPLPPRSNPEVPMKCRPWKCFSKVYLPFRTVKIPSLYAKDWSPSPSRIVSIYAP